LVQLHLLPKPQNPVKLNIINKDARAANIYSSNLLDASCRKQRVKS